MGCRPQSEGLYCPPLVYVQCLLPCFRVLQKPPPLPPLRELFMPLRELFDPSVNYLPPSVNSLTPP